MARHLRKKEEVRAVRPGNVRRRRPSLLKGRIAEFAACEWIERRGPALRLCTTDYAGPERTSGNSRVRSNRGLTIQRIVVRANRAELGRIEAMRL